MGARFSIRREVRLGTGAERGSGEPEPRTVFGLTFWARRLRTNDCGSSPRSPVVTRGGIVGIVAAKRDCLQIRTAGVDS